MTRNSLKKLSIFILIIGILCTCLFGCTDKHASGNDVKSTTESTAKGGENTTNDVDSGEKGDSSVNKEKSPVKKDDETTTKKVDKETTTKSTTTTEPTTESYTPTPLVPLTAEQELKIKQDYLEFNFEKSIALGEEGDDFTFTIDDISILEYFGMYQDCVVVIMGGPFDGIADVITVNEIAGYMFVYPQQKIIKVYRNGDFVTLEQAYKNGWISDENIRDIYYYHTTLH